ncbi:hypothetical protein [Natroniella sp. ANB-PHB2]|uniref:hypothetical protein n=1 Tax=Natroniella sp. ANB-PHB2 TaxID=3384444 RepID=UPI0038D44C18
MIDMLIPLVLLLIIMNVGIIARGAWSGTPKRYMIMLIIFSNIIFVVGFIYYWISG